MAVLDETGPVRSLRMGKGEPLVLIHPFTTNARIWRGVAEELADRFDVLMVTLPGHYGADPASFFDITIGRMADFVESEMDAVGWDTAHLAGNSLGGWLSLELAARDRARTVTAIAPAGGWHPFDVRRMLPLASKFIAIAPLALTGRLLEPLVRDWSFAHRIMLSLVVGEHRAVEPVDSLAMMRASTHCGGYLAVLLNGARHGGMHKMDEVDVPVRLALCEKDLIIPPDVYGSLFERGLPNVHTVMLEGVGHVPMLEAPEMIADLIREHALNHTLAAAV